MGVLVIELLIDSEIIEYPDFLYSLEGLFYRSNYLLLHC
ncbi:hypothetical protein AsAng_0011350 [Aureispira anguillae]|uniref:Uncharacterized protein n=1 Tax=Aureispira anguillae TaxID=2864201 RepID=A0A915YC85_9BACT|nr:hypothetical protein AsAng_0011350 [Aureispira anguillae]